MDKQVTNNKIEQLIGIIDGILIPTCSECDKSDKLAKPIFDLKALAIQIRAQIRKA